MVSAVILLTHTTGLQDVPSVWSPGEHAVQVPGSGAPLTCTLPSPCSTLEFIISAYAVGAEAWPPTGHSQHGRVLTGASEAGGHGALSS